jgi:hypothetical protein
MPLSREPFFSRMVIWLKGLERWYLVLGGVAVGREFELQSDQISLLEVCLSQVISKAVFGHLSASDKGSRFG